MLSSIFTAEEKRVMRLMPMMWGQRIPKHIRIYDNGGPGHKWTTKNGETFEGDLVRYTVVFTGNYPGRHGQDVLLLSPDAYSPGGYGNVDRHFDHPIDSPTYGHLGKKIHFLYLPEACQKAIVRDYTFMWGLRKSLGMSEEY